MIDDFNYFETTADIGVKVQSKTLEDAFKNAALGSLNLITEINKIKNIITKNVVIESEDLKALLYDWITELIALVDCEQFIGSSYDIKITKDENYKLIATISGDTFDIDKYTYKTEIKAITYHNMKIEQENDYYNIQFIIDI